MLIGEYRHTIDEKKRMALPAVFRRELGRKVIVTRGLDKCLFVYPVASWPQILSQLKNFSLGQADARGFGRFFLSGAVEAEIDALGRILIPDYLKDFAGLKSRVVVTGLNDRVEIWEEKRWKEYAGRIEKQADRLAEKLGAVGMF